MHALLLPLLLVPSQTTYTVTEPIDTCSAAAVNTLSWAVAQAQTGSLQALNDISLATDVNVTGNCGITVMNNNLHSNAVDQVRSIQLQGAFVSGSTATSFVRVRIISTGSSISLTSVTATGVQLSAFSSVNFTGVNLGNDPSSLARSSVSASTINLFDGTYINSGTALVANPTITATGTINVQSARVQNADLSAPVINVYNAQSGFPGAISGSNVNVTTALSCTGMCIVEPSNVTGLDAVYTPNAAAPPAPVLTAVVPRSPGRVDVHGTFTGVLGPNANVDILATTATGFKRIGLLSNVANNATTDVIAFVSNNLVLDAGAEVFLTVTNANYTKDLQHFTSAFSTQLPAAKDVVTFDTTSLEAEEADGSIDVVLHRAVGGGAATIAVTTTNGTATAGADYTAFSGNATFGDGSTTTTITIPILEDSAAEANESFTVTLGASDLLDGSTAGSATVTIHDNDAELVTFASSELSVDEGAGSVEVVLKRTGTTGLLTVALATGNGTATAGADYTPYDAIVTFQDGADTAIATIAIANDTVHEDDETFAVGAGELPSDVSVRGTLSVTILDDDAAAGTGSSGGGFVPSGTATPTKDDLSCQSVPADFIMALAALVLMRRRIARAG